MGVLGVSLLVSAQCRPCNRGFLIVNRCSHFFPLVSPPFLAHANGTLMSLTQTILPPPPGPRAWANTPLPAPALPPPLPPPVPREERPTAPPSPPVCPSWVSESAWPEAVAMLVGWQ